MGRTRRLWMKSADDDILGYLDEIDGELTASAIALNLDTGVSYGEIVHRLSILEEYRLVERTQDEWGYYGLTQAGKAYLDGEIELDSDTRVDEDSDQRDSASEESKKSDSSSEDQSHSLLPPEGKPDIESLRVTQTEAREVLNKQIEALDRLDAKAAETLRLNVVILGVLLTLISVFVSNNSTPDIDRFPTAAIILGVVFTLFSIVAAFWTYTSTRKETGPDPGDIERLASHEYNEKRWLIILVRSCAQWIKKNNKMNQRDTRALFLGHILLFMSLGYYSFSILWGILFYNRSNWILFGSLLVISILFPVIILLPRLPYIERLRAKIWEITEPYWDQLYD